MDGWTWTTHTPSSASASSVPPATATSAPNPGLTLTSLPRRLGDALPAPLPTPSSTSPRPPTPHEDGTGDQGPGVRSPPTPAPSPGPGHREAWKRAAADAAEGEPIEVDGEEEHAHARRGERGEGMDVEMDGGDGQAATRRKGKGRTQADPDSLLEGFKALSLRARYTFLSALVAELQLPEALVVTRRIEPRLRRDFLRELPTELALHCLSFIDDAKTLARASQVSRFWTGLLQDENTWKEMCDKHRFTAIRSPINYPRDQRPQAVARTTRSLSGYNVPTGGLDAAGRKQRSASGTAPGEPGSSPSLLPSANTAEPSFRQQFKTAYQTESNWLHGGRVLAAHTSQGDAVVTSLAIDDNYLIIGMADGPIHVFDATTGAFKRSLAGHENGVWTLVLVSAEPDLRANTPNLNPKAGHNRGYRSKSAYRDSGQPRRSSFNNLDAFNAGAAPTDGWGRGIPRPNTVMGLSGDGGPGGETGGRGGAKASKPTMSDVCNAAKGWGNRRPLIVSGGCDRLVKVWDIMSGQLIHSMRGHTSTVRCVKVLDGKPIAVSGSRDHTVRVWNLETGELLRTMLGHEQSVRCIEVAGNKVVSGSYDYTCRLWDIDTGECIHVLRGHYHQIYAVAYDGERIVSGSLDSTIRVWDAETGVCTSLLQGHTSLVGQLQLSGDTLVTGGSDGRVITFNLSTGLCVHRLCAHDNSVTCLQFDDRFIISGGNDGRVKLWDFRTGTFIRELSKPGEAVWRVAFRDDQCAILLQRQGKTILEVVSFKPPS